MKGTKCSLFQALDHLLGNTPEIIPDNPSAFIAAATAMSLPAVATLKAYFCSFFAQHSNSSLEI